MDFNIAAYLEKFRNLKPSGLYVKEAFIEVLKEKLDVELEKDEMKVQGDTIFLQTHPTIKSEIFLQKNSILELLEEKLKKKTIKNIV